MKLQSRALALALAAPAAAAPQLDFAPQVSADGALPRYDVANPADFDGDGRTDLVAESSAFFFLVELLQRTGDATFIRRPLEPDPSFCSSAAIADFNGDGRMDFAVEIWNGNPTDGILVYFGSPGTGPVQGVRIAVPSVEISIADSLEACDFDGDGDPDLVHCDRQIGRFVAYENDGAGQFTELARTVGSVTSFLAVDLDEDGREDLVHRPGASWMRSLGDGRFAPPVDLIPSGPAPGSTWRAGDVDGDGDEDLFATNLWVENLPGVAVQVRTDFDAGPGTPVINRVADLDLDGQPDLLSIFAAELFWHRGLGQGTFAPRQSIPGFPSGFPGVDQRLITAIDLDDDLDLDIVVGRDALATRSAAFVRNVTDHGTGFCTPAPNSVGTTGAIEVTGSLAAPTGRLALTATGVPPDEFTLFVTSLDAAPPVMPAGSAGFLCLGGAIGRFNRSGEIIQSDAGGAARLLVELADVPDALLGSVAIAGGETRRFQAWHRDGPAGSNFTDAVAVQFP